VIVTIDGPAGTGKSTVAHLLARRLGLEFLDTGAMYRAITLAHLDRGGDPRDASAVAKTAARARLRFDFDRDPPELLLDGDPVGARIRAQRISDAVSLVAAHPAVREAMVAEQRAIAEEHPRLVTEGRDQGTVVFPEADVKFYLDADPAIRAARRARQLRAAGNDADESAILAAIIERDRLDSERATGRLACAADAIRIDTGRLEVGEVVDRLEELSRPRLGSLLEVTAGDVE
jgi:cytidylate kinase